MSSRIAVIGTGYVGLTTGVCFAHLGHRVTCVDVDAAKVERLRRGELPIVEDGLGRLLGEGIASGRLDFTTSAAEAVVEAEFVFLCVQTPQGEDGSADLTYLRQAAEDIAPSLRTDGVVVNKSTVPVGSTKVVERVLQRSDVKVVSNPEFLREGTAVHDFLNPDRVVIGSEDQAAGARVARLYAGVSAPVQVTDPASAETIKYASNAFLATKLSFVNAVAAVCEAVGADVRAVTLGMGYDHRIGQDFMTPGPGWGGSCFPKDTRALLRIAEEHGYDFDLLRGVIAVNEEQFERVVDKVAVACGGSVSGRTIAAWGLTFKAGTDDTRDSPALQVIGRLLDRGARVRGYDPAGVGPFDGRLATLELAEDPYEACEGADVLVVLTEWEQFKWCDLGRVAERLAAKRIVDTRNLLDRTEAARLGLSYVGIGRA